MVKEYVERFYLPAVKRYSDLAADSGAKLGPILEWRKQFRTAGSQVKITRVQAENSHEIRVGEKMRVTASIVLGEIRPEYVRVQIVSGSVNEGAMIMNGFSSDMKLAGIAENEHQYEGQLECLESGSYGFSVRVIPYHPDVRVPFEHPWLVWAD
jgi:starch phosphorylase